MKGMIFAAGIGSRLKPWTDSHPKALVDLGGKPALHRVIDKFVSAGITEIIINIHHFSDQIRHYVGSHRFDAEIVFSDESDNLLDTGGGLRKALPLIGDESVVVHNADILTDFPLESLMASHIAAGNSGATLAVEDRGSTRRLLFGRNDGLLKGWMNLTNGQTKPEGFKPSGDEFAYSYDGVFVMSPDMYGPLEAYAADGVPFSIIDFLISNARHCRVKAWELPQGSRWFDIGTPEKLDIANKFLASHSCI